MPAELESHEGHTSFAYNLGASLVWSLFDGGERRAQADAADARRDAGHEAPPVG